MLSSHLQRFIDDAVNSSAMFDRNMTYLAASPGWLEEHCVGREAMGRSHYDVFPNIPHPWKKLHQRGLSGERISVEADRFHAPDGKAQWANWEIRPWFEIDGAVGGILIFTENISALKEREIELESSQRRLHIAQEGAGIAVWEWDLGSDAPILNDAVRKMFGLGETETFPLDDFMTCLHPDDAAACQDAHRQMLSGHGDLDQRFRFFRRDDGALRWIHTKASVLPDASGHPEWLAGVNIDITDDMEREGALLESRRRLQIQADQLQALNQSVEAANKAKTAFIAAMSHEIRTPLNAIVGFANLIAHARTDDEQAQFITTMLSSTRHLTALVNDILDFTKLESGHVKIEREPFNLGDLLDEIGVTMTALVGDKPITTGVQRDDRLPTTIQGDRGRVTQILLNLLGNAAKFTRSGSLHLKVAPRSRADGTTTIRFDIADTGQGISQSIRPLLFQPFEQGSASPEARVSGTGLGLVISRRLAHLMGGTVDFESEEGRGSIFWFEAPFECGAPQDDRHAAAQPSSGEAPTRGTRRLNILVAEDAIASRMLLKVLLTRRGHRVEDVEDGKAALDAAERTPFDLILMDIQMPVMDGLDATRRIRSLTGHAATTPIVALTAEAFDEQRQEALDAGIDKVLTKPLNTETLDRILQDVSDTGRLRRAE